MISGRDIQAFETDGVVCLRGAFEERWLDLIARGIERNKKEPGPFFRDQTPEGSPARYVFDYWTWPEVPEFGKVIADSPAGEIAGRLMGAKETTLIMDNWFMREAGATNGAPWHHDEPYFDFQGRMCNVLIPLEPAKQDELLRFVKGSHRWGKVFMAMNFREHIPFDAQENGYEPVPDIDAQIESNAEAHELLSWDLEPGDCLVFDLRTLHAAASGRKPLDRTIHRFSLRFAAEGARFVPRGPWTQEITDHLRSLGQTDNAPLNCPLLPKVWARQDEAA